MAEFAHLHLHTEFSLLDGMGRTKEYAERALQLGIQHVAITDHGVMYGAMEWYKTAKAAGLHPIVGVEAYLAEGSAKARERKSYHLLLLAENETGYRNLLQLSTRAQLEGYYYRPRIDLEMLSEHGSGIIATSACLGGPVANNFLHGRPELARQYAGDLAEIFGPGRFFIELQDHGIPEQSQVNGDLIALARDLDLPLVVTNDVHYCRQEDASAQDLLVCIQTNTTLDDPKRLKTDSSQLFLKSPEEMARLFPELPEAMANTIRIAEMCSLDLEFRGYHLPEFPIPPGFSPDSYLEHLVQEGLQKRYGHVTGPVAERMHYELGVIRDMGFANYFLVVWDFIRFAREQGILVGPGRGSSAGSIVTYGLEITALDPLKHNLIFERFLNPSRISMPDIDIDFADDRRGEVIDYVVAKYGADRVAQIVTFGTLGAKAAVRDVGRAMGHSFGETDRVAKLIPVGPGITIDNAMEKVPELKSLYDGDDEVRALIDTARKVEGISRHSSTHAAGVVISRDPLVQHVPLQRAGGKSEGDVTTQFPMAQLEELGLLKMDFLGLRTLTVLGKAVDLLQQSGHNISLETIPLEDPAAFALLQRGETTGVFQLEGGTTARMTVEVAPKTFDDLTALMALIRPGPMAMAPEYISRKHGLTVIEYIHPEVEPILSETYGVALYQEQVMRIANVLAGFSMAEGDGLRKAMGKKLPEQMAKYQDRFISGCVERQIDRKLAAEIFAMIERFAGYGFPKAHSAAYAVIAAQTAYLKANFPVEFMAALLSTELGNTERIVALLAECRRANIAVLPPSINRSDVEFSVEPGEDGSRAVRFGLAAIKGVGATAVRTILASRAEQPGERFSSFAALCDAVDWSAVNRRTLETLAKAGALDELGHRGGVLEALEATIAAAQKRQRASARGQMDLFGAAAAESAPPVEIPVADLPSRQVLEWEKELLGTYMSDHPLSSVVRDALRSPDGRNISEIAQLEERPVGSPVRVLAMVANVRRIVTKTNRTMAVAIFEDLSGRVDVVLFPEAYERQSELLADGAILDVRGRLERRGEALQIVCESLTAELPAAVAAPEEPDPVIVRFAPSGDEWAEIRAMQQADEIIQRYEGANPVVLEIPVQAGQVCQLRSRSRRVEWSADLERELLAVEGVAAVTLLTDQPARLAS
ncbi:MAG: DNA polymerase III subunit alpha [Thermomicrobiales bacterium]|nr:DNA polymerase III subunit alpha [Thermomicrobiales bacterium]